MTERRKDLLWLACLFVLMLLFYSKILFTDKIIRAPDIINEFYWGVISQKAAGFADIWDFSKVSAGWNIFINSGFTSEGGYSPAHFLFWNKLILKLIPAPACVAWHIIIHLFFGACGLYLFCRAIGLGRPSAFLAGLIFALAPENATLINAGHVMKVATISYAPWALYSIEKGFITRRAIFFLATGFILAFQFFNSHWQIAYYTCLTIGLYGMIRSVIILRSAEERAAFTVPKLVGMNLVVLCFFLSTVSVGLLPTANWSKDTNRGVQSGANQGKGGLNREEAMNWSLPPEETASFIIPGLFGLSRQEGGENPENIISYYWGRMIFTQTVSYMGLLPWLLVPLPLIFRRDKYTWLAVAAVAGGVLFSMGKYTPFYNLLYDFFPGINRFRVPKMIMFVPVMGLGVLSALGIELLQDGMIRKTAAFRRYIWGVLALPVALLVLLGAEIAGRDFWLSALNEMISQPTRYEQGAHLIGQRWFNLVVETAFATGLAVCFAACYWFFSKGRMAVQVFLALLCVLYVADVWRVDNKVIFTVKTPEKAGTIKTPIMEYVRRASNQFRVLPMNGEDPMHYVNNGIPVMYTPNPVQQMRWQQILDSFNVGGPVTDMLNVKYLVMVNQEYWEQKNRMSGKYAPVFTSPDGSSVVLENRAVLSKAWIVPSVALVKSDSQRLAILQDPGFVPLSAALVESQPPLAMANPGDALPPLPQSVTVPLYEGEHIVVRAATTRNALLVLGEKYYKGWKAEVDGKPAEIVPVNHILRGVYLTPGSHTVEFRFDPLPFKIGKYLTLASFALFAGMLIREWLLRRKKVNGDVY